MASSASVAICLINKNVNTGAHFFEGLHSLSMVQCEERRANSLCMVTSELNL